MRQVFKLPDVGEGLTEAEILSWQVAVGDTVTVNQILVEIETAKAAVELPSPYAGTVVELLAEPGATVEVGVPIIAISDGQDEPAAAEPAASRVPAAAEPAAAEHPGAKIGEAGAGGRIATLVGYGPKPGSVTRRARKAPPAFPRVGAPSTPSRRSEHTERPAPDERPAEAAAEQPTEQPAASGTVPLAKPPVRKLARELGVDLHEVSGSGPGGVITREDVRTGGSPSGNGAVAEAAEPTGTPSGTGERRVPIRGVRKATAAAMVSSAFTAPHVTEFLTVDVTPMIQLRDRLRATRDYRDVKLSPLTFAAKAVCLAARRTPEVNASWDDAAQEIVYFEHVQLGIAAATPRGLIVPKIRDADRLSLRELAGALGELTETARSGKTPPADLVGGTFTITNVGVFGVDTGTPILNPGESAILALGAVKQAPWVVDGQLAVRTVCQLALSFDHRVVDGEQGSRFLADVGSLLADPGLAMTY
ncbi:MAG TPA: dihydrolipoamide acetyltransferase family protein [Pseudonocardia sp.]|uniref:dihydrolipoamide acetyltransferase family protein n=1 Tax=Pseudonocardia sp. TaxID=60912 RepID=UPI002B5231C2|nr:dihydrolipoamide acetyltransferase family protein [Pseudonocardia sp.]HTF55506.1 dihydrolipoamide acetyltransferase family protein [Pseudonocardia sp.]